MLYQLLSFLYLLPAPYGLEFLEEVAAQSSKTERTAEEAERDVEKMKKVPRRLVLTREFCIFAKYMRKN